MYLHSNMVRFIINKKNEDDKKKNAFTFQYGQIYYAWNRSARSEF